MTRRTEEEAAARTAQRQHAGEALRAERPNKNANKFYQTLKEIENDHQEEA